MNTISIDENLDNERNLAMVEGTKMLVQSLRINGDIDKSTEDRCTQTFQKNLADMDKTVSSEFDKEMELLLRKLSTKNKVRQLFLSPSHEVGRVILSAARLSGSVSLSHFQAISRKAFDGLFFILHTHLLLG